MHVRPLPLVIRWPDAERGGCPGSQQPAVRELPKCAAAEQEGRIQRKQNFTNHLKETQTGGELEVTAGVCSSTFQKGRAVDRRRICLKANG